MSNERTRDRGNLFENAEKRKPSQPDLQGDCSIDGHPYEIRAWRRDDQLTITFAPPRGDKNTYPPDVYRGSMEAVPAKRASARGAKDEAPIPAWSGEISSDEATYTIRAFEKQGKSGTYFTLQFERAEHRAATASVAPDDDDDAPWNHSAG
jgi:hypothetical protein